MNYRKTLLITLDFWPKVGGVANYYFNLCNNLDKHKIVVLTQKESREKLAFKVYRESLLGNFIWPKWLGMFRQIFKIVKKEKIELIWAGEILPTGTVVYFLSKFLKMPYIVSCHGNDVLQAKRMGRKRKLAKKVLGGAKYVVVNSNYTGDLVEGLGVDKDKIRVIYPGVDKFKVQSSEFKVKEKLLKKYNLKHKKILLSVGRLVERKGFDMVIQSLPKVWQAIEDLIYVVAGDGPDAERLRGLTDDARIKFLGRVSDEEKWRLMEVSDVFIMLPREDKDDVEGFGIVYLEAASLAKPVIAGNTGGAKEAVVDGQTGILVKPESIEEISQAIIELFNNKALAKRLGENSRSRVEECFGWNKVIEGLKEILG